MTASSSANAQHQRRAAQRTVRCNRLLGGSRLRLSISGTSARWDAWSCGSARRLPASFEFPAHLRFSVSPDPTITLGCRFEGDAPEGLLVPETEPLCRLECDSGSP